MNALTDKTDELNIDALAAAWLQFDGLAHLRPLETPVDYDYTISLLTKIWEEIGESEQHPLLTLRMLLDSMVMAYEEIHYPAVHSEPHELLEFMIEQGERASADFAGILEPAELEEILAGRRDIDEKTAIQLAAFFKVTPQVFLKQE
ncbi:hypothetical protein [Rugamonas sp.]|uniref:hypothetical protein n=1 Tax=Rugamonas sp. TaxID=1926287 RepID=UPI0025F22A1F|nr:hypothetical protein [Rugamonas sp.]